MREIRTHTENSNTYKLKQSKDDEGEFIVTKNGRRIGGGVYSYAEAERMFRELVTGHESTDDSDSGDTGPSLPGMGGGMMGSGGGGAPTLPGAGA